MGRRSGRTKSLLYHNQISHEMNGRSGRRSSPCRRPHGPMQISLIKRCTRIHRDVRFRPALLRSPGVGAGSARSRPVRHQGQGNARKPCLASLIAVRTGWRMAAGPAGNCATIWPSSTERGTARGWATRTIAGTGVPGGSVWNVTDQGNPGNPRPLQCIGDGHLRVWPW